MIDNTKKLKSKKPSILGIGGSGLIGSRIVELLFDQYNFINLSLETGVDITKPQTLDAIRNDERGAVILHLAAKTDVDRCEEDRMLGEHGDAWKINVLGTQNVVAACKKTNKKIIYISTDFVFDGTINRGGYTEEDPSHPINWYGETKYRGEEIVKKSGLPFLILRLAYPYRALFPPKKDFVRALIVKLQNKEKIKAVFDHVITPTFIDDIVHALDTLICANATGIYHVVGSEFISPYGASLLVARTFDFDLSLIQKVSRDEYFKDRAPRPFNLSLENGKIEKLGVKMKTFEEGLEEVKRQLVGY